MHCLLALWKYYTYACFDVCIHFCNDFVLHQLVWPYLYMWFEFSSMGCVSYASPGLLCGTIMFSYLYNYTRTSVPLAMVICFLLEVIWYFSWTNCEPRFTSRYIRHEIIGLFCKPISTNVGFKCKPFRSKLVYSYYSWISELHEIPHWICWFSLHCLSCFRMLWWKM